MPQQAWSRKDERKYEHIKESAKEIAARTVNRDRRLESRTKSGRKTTTGTGNPTASLEDRTVEELYNRGKELDIGGRSKM
jgi:hypothetical protein